MSTTMAILRGLSVLPLTALVAIAVFLTAERPAPASESERTTAVDLQALSMPTAERNLEGAQTGTTVGAGEGRSVPTYGISEDGTAIDAILFIFCPSGKDSVPYTEQAVLSARTAGWSKRHIVLLDASYDGHCSAGKGSEFLRNETGYIHRTVPFDISFAIRNTFEHAVGHFVNPTSNDEDAVDPQMTNFASFDTNYCARNAHDLRDKKVLMYCTGGVRCEKASAMLRKRGVNDVSQLSGGIHRYLERYGSGGLFKGKNFVFDQRVAIAPGPPPADADADANANADVSGCDGTSEGGADSAVDSSKSRTESQVIVVGKCVDCSAAYDEISGSRICTVCRDLVLVCPPCQQRLREYHCQRHSGWKDCYFTFLDMFDKPDLEQQACRLSELRDGLVPPPQHKNVRKTLMRQVNKVRARIQELEAGTATVDREAPRRCRTCHEPDSVCDGLCWGFWKRTTVVVGAEHREGARQVGNSDTCNATALTASDESNGNKRQLHFDVAASADGVTNCGKPLPVDVGDRVKPGPDWNDIRLGTKTISGDENTLITGHVVEIKSWGSGGAGDCVSVVWDKGNSKSGQSGADGKMTFTPAKPKIYRWGVLAKNGQRMYDVEKFASDS